MTAKSTPATPIPQPPSMGFPDTLTPFRFFCQRVLPAVYSDEISYYELLCKVADYLNKTMSNVNDLNDDMKALKEYIDQLYEWVDHYFDNLDVQYEINKKLDMMVADGTFAEIVKPFIAPFYQQYLDEVQGLIKEVAKLQSEVESIVVGSGDTEVSDAHVDWYGYSYPTLKARIDELDKRIADGGYIRDIRYNLEHGQWVVSGNTFVFAPAVTGSRYAMPNPKPVPEGGIYVWNSPIYTQETNWSLIFFDLSSEGEFTLSDFNPYATSGTALTFTRRATYIPYRENLYFVLQFGKVRGEDAWYTGSYPWKVQTTDEYMPYAQNSIYGHMPEMILPFISTTGAIGFKNSQSGAMFRMNIDEAKTVYCKNGWSASALLYDAAGKALSIITNESYDSVDEQEGLCLTVLDVPDKYNGVDVANVYIGVRKSGVATGDGIQKFNVNFMARYQEIIDNVIVVPRKQLNETSIASYSTKTVFDNADKLKNIRWTPVLDGVIPMQPTSAGATQLYFNNQEFAGIPYGSDWLFPHFVGWHVSPRTFITAVQNPNSVMYTKYTVPYAGKKAAYYSDVCSSYVSKCLNMPYPMTNETMVNYASDFFDVVPIDHRYTPMPGDILEQYGNTSHCGIVRVVKSTEGLPLMVGIDNEQEPITTFFGMYVNAVSALRDYSRIGDDFNYVLRPKTATEKLEGEGYVLPPSIYVPPLYGNVLLDKGDMSVYMQTESVYASVNDDEATQILIYKGGTLTDTLSIDSLSPVVKNGMREVDVTQYCQAEGVYTFSTDKEPKVQTMYRAPQTTIGYDADTRTVTFTGGEGWYICVANSENKAIQLPCGDGSVVLPDEIGTPVEMAVFFKHQYGAYATERLSV